MTTSNIMIFDHPLINHKLALLRDKSTGMRQFRELIEEITTLMCYEVFKDVPTEEILVETPLEGCRQKVIQEHSVAIIPILRAGLGMVNGVHNLMPTAKVGHIGLYRDEESLMPKEYYCKLPIGIEDMFVVIVDPMLATGGSAAAAITNLKERGIKKIKMMNIIAAPEGIEVVSRQHPDVEVYIGACDRKLNECGYILPGLGDAGDRLFGTK